ncbi:hypothetical protein [Thomasclavelia cocleata]|uniref:hypothetical protein n=1 Tax=Thomasclavelia cocleata TaxID=69824 RepID=UPI00242B28DD|nr:hypothetical protein [Thomasclavelia cocleata]
MSFSFLGVFCGIFVFISAVIYFMVDYRQNKDDANSTIQYFISKIFMAIVFGIVVAVAISM